jgi:outer membrane protein assembly factor BamB
MLHEIKARKILIILLVLSAGISFSLLACKSAQERGGWSYPLFNCANNAANPQSSCSLLEKPQESWVITLEKGDIPYALFPVAADIDGDGRLEYILSGWNAVDLKEYWLAAFNIEDGSLQWKNRYDSNIHWSAPIAVDMDGNGSVEVVFATDQELMVIKGTDGSIVWSVPFLDGLGLTVAEMNKDKFLDIIIADRGNPPRLNLLNGRDGASLWDHILSGSTYNIPAVADLDEDGTPEIILHSHQYDPALEELVVFSNEGEPLWRYVSSPSPEQTANAPQELGWVPDFGYIPTAVADFDADGNLDIGWGTRCHYYALDRRGNLIWEVPLVEGFGILRIHHADGTVDLDTHGTGGPSGYAAGIGSLDDSPGVDIILAFQPEYLADWYEETGSMVYEEVSPSNVLRAYDGQNGSLLWTFEGSYLSDKQIDIMHEPILVDVTGDKLLDVLALSSDQNLYVLRGRNGQPLLTYPLSPGEDEFFWVSHHLTFVADEESGIVLFITGTDSTSPPTAYLHALQIANGCR